MCCWLEGRYELGSRYDAGEWSRRIEQNRMNINVVVFAE